MDNVLRYVGKGTGDRFKHCNSGKSTCALLNRDYFNDCKVLLEELMKEKDDTCIATFNVFSFKLMKYLDERGFKFIGTKQMSEDQSKTIFWYKDSPEIRRAVKDYTSS